MGGHILSEDLEKWLGAEEPRMCMRRREELCSDMRGYTQGT